LPLTSEAKEPIPADEHHLHFGGGQTEAVLRLPPSPYAAARAWRLVARTVQSADCVASDHSESEIAR